MPFVLFGMAVAIGIASIAWSRAWTRRTTSAHAEIAWQAQLLAESGTACAVQEALARNGSKTAKDSTSKDTTKAKVEVRDTADTACVFHGPAPGAMSWDEPAGTQLLSIRATGSVMEGGKPLVAILHSIWGGNPPADAFAPAISLWDKKVNDPRIAKRNGTVQVNYTPAPAGTESHKAGSIEQFVPTSLANDTTFAAKRMAAAFRSEEAHLGGESFTPNRPPPDRDSLIYTIGDVIFDAPWAGDTWNVGKPRILFVEGRVEFRGKLKLKGWTVYAKGPIVIQDDAEVSGIDLYSAGGVQISDRSRVSGQILSAGQIVVSGEARLVSPSFTACWPGKGRDSLPLFSLANRAQADVYAVVLGGAAEVRIAQGAILRGVGVSGGILRNDGQVEGLAVAGRLDCGQGESNCSNGSFNRSRMPVDFAYPLGLPDNKGFRLLSWETGE